MNNSIIESNMRANENYLKHLNNIEGSKIRSAENIRELCENHPELIEEAKLYINTGAYGNEGDTIIGGMEKVQEVPTLSM